MRSTRWSFVVALLAACGSGGGDTQLPADTTPPTDPQGLTANAVVGPAIALSWSASVDDRGVAGYQVHRNGAPYQDTTATSFDDGGLAPSTTHCYRVLAFDAAGNRSGLSAQACATTSAAGTTATLTVARGGAGSGTVTGAGISCGADCSETVTTGTSIVLTATPAAGSTFSGWAGCDAPSGATCTMSMTGSKSVTASFGVPGSATLTVARGGAGSGTVTGAGISCGADCSETVTTGTSIVLTATPAAGSTFSGWAGCDAPSGATCTMSMTASKSVTASFALGAVCTPGATRCVAGDIEVQQRCNAGGTAWVQEACGAWRLCAKSTCRVACGMTSAPPNPTSCLVPIGDGVNDGEWTYWTDSRMTSGTSVVARSITNSGGYATIYDAPAEAWPYTWSIGWTDVVGADFKLNQFSYPRHPALGFRARRAGIVTGYTNNFLVGVFVGTTSLGSCSGLATFGWTVDSCSVGTPLNQSLNYTGGWNGLLLSITGDGFGGAIDLMDVNYVYLTIAP